MKSDIGDEFVPSTSGIANACGRIIGRVRTMLEDACQRHLLANELAGLAGDGELDSVLAEAGLARGQVPRLIQGHAEAPRLLEAMTHRLGIERDAIADRELLREIERTCSLCDSRALCRRWLRSGATDGYHTFCPNAEWFDHIGRGQGHGKIAGEPRTELAQPAATMLPDDAMPTVREQSDRREHYLRALMQEPYV